MSEQETREYLTHVEMVTEYLSPADRYSDEARQRYAMARMVYGMIDPLFED